MRWYVSLKRSIRSSGVRALHEQDRGGLVVELIVFGNHVVRVDLEGNDMAAGIVKHEKPDLGTAPKVRLALDRSVERRVFPVSKPHEHRVVHIGPAPIVEPN